jgi:glycosyltransferase involved in cell wall biosynthesis
VSAPDWAIRTIYGPTGSIPAERGRDRAGSAAALYADGLPMAASENTAPQRRRGSASLRSASQASLRKLAIVPAYNESGMVARVVRDILREEAGFDVLVVDDGSTDATAAEAETAGATVIRHPYNLGIGGAVQSGYKYALRHDYDVAVQVDGDGQHKPEYLPELLDALHTGDEQADMVYGSRFRGDPGYKVPVGRRIGNLIFSVVLSVLIRQKITDPTSGFRMTNRRGIELFARDYPHDYPEVEALLMLHAHRLRIHEVHVRMNARGFGQSSIDYPRSAYYMVKVMLALFVGLFRRRPTPIEATGEDEPGIAPPAEPQATSAEAIARGEREQG